MSNFFNELVAVTGSEDTALKVLKVFDRTNKDAELTEKQEAVYQYLLSGAPIYSARRLARDCGLDHPQKLVAILSALVIKGYLVPIRNRD